MKHDFYEDQAARVYYDKSLHTLFLEYRGKVKNDDHFVAINTAVLNAFKDLDTHKFVADIRKMGVISLSSQNWVVSVLLPAMVKHLQGKQLFHAQLLDAQEIFSKVSAGNIKSKSVSVSDSFEVFQYYNENELRQHLTER